MKNHHCKWWSPSIRAEHSKRCNLHRPRPVSLALLHHASARWNVVKQWPKHGETQFSNDKHTETDWDWWFHVISTCFQPIMRKSWGIILRFLWFFFQQKATLETTNQRIDCIVSRGSRAHDLQCHCACRATWPKLPNPLIYPSLPICLPNMANVLDTTLL